ncbi:MAG TPA: DinB family protein, partial [Anaerolineae bacterium]
MSDQRTNSLSYISQERNMPEDTLFQAVARMAELTHGFSDADLGQPWAWRKHDEGVRFALIGTYHELRELAVELAKRRAEDGPPVTRAQRALAQYLVAYRDLQAVLIGVTDEDYEREPAAGEWPLRYVVGHTAGTQRHFFTLVQYGLARQRDGQERPARLPEGETDRVTGSYEEFGEIMEKGSMADMLAFYDKLHQRTLNEFATITDEELTRPSLWWEGEAYSLEYRLHRFDAHLRQHTIQAEKTLA